MNDQKLSADLARYLRRKRALILAGMVGWAILATVYAFFIADKYYKATATFLPPSSNVGLLASFSLGGERIPFAGSHEMTASQIQTVFNGESFKRLLIQRFNLSKRYRTDRGEAVITRTLKKMGKLIRIKSEESAGLGYSEIISLSIEVEDRNPDTAAMICHFAYHALDSMISSLNSGRARASRQFVEMQLIRNEQILDSLQKEMLAFQQENKVVDVPAQAKLAIDVAGQLKARLIQAQIERSAIQSIQGVNSSQVRVLDDQIANLQAHLRQLEAGRETGFFPSLVKSTKLAPKFLNLTRDIEVKTRMVALLVQQLEVERSEEIKKISPLQLVDDVFVPDYKFRPKRILLWALVFIFGNGILFVGVIYAYYMKVLLRKSVFLRELLSPARGA